MAKRHKELEAAQPINVSEYARDYELLKAASPYKERALKKYIKKYLSDYNISCRTQGQGRPKDIK